MDILTFVEGLSADVSETTTGYSVTVRYAETKKVRRVYSGRVIQYEAPAYSRLTGHGVQRVIAVLDKSEVRFDAKNDGLVTTLSFSTEGKSPVVGYSDSQTLGFVTASGFMIDFGILSGIAGIFLTPRRNKLEISAERDVLHVSRKNSSTDVHLAFGSNLECGITSTGDKSLPVRLLIRRKSPGRTAALEETLMEFVPPIISAFRWSPMTHTFRDTLLIVRERQEAPLGDAEFKAFIEKLRAAEGSNGASSLSQDSFVFGDGESIDYTLELVTKGFLGDTKDAVKLSVK